MVGSVEPWIDWEGAAEELLDATATSAPVDAFKLARACGLDVRPWSGRDAALSGETIYVNTRMRPSRQQGRVAHEIGHFALQRAGLEDSEAGAAWVGGALQLPRRELNPDLRRTAWSISKIRSKHLHASAAAVAVRITQLRDAVITILDPRGRKKLWRLPSPWIDDPRLARVSAWERDLARQAYEAREEVRGDELCYAWPVLEDDSEHRVIVVCELEQLSLRL